MVDADQMGEYVARVRRSWRNKVDLAGPERTAWLRSRMDEMMHRLLVVETTFCDVPWGVPLSTDTSAMRLTEPPVDPAPARDHGLEFDRWTFESAEPLSLIALKRMVRLELPGTVYRLKGFVHADDDPEHRYLVHTVGRRSKIRRDDAWGDHPPTTRLVAIAAAGELDEHWLHDAIGRCARRSELAGT